jgi:hypothetical protein
MATFTAARAAATFPVAKTVGGGVLHASWGTIEVLANPTPGDVYEMCRVPAGAVIVGGQILSEDMDVNAAETLNLSVGWAANGVDAANSTGLSNFGVASVDTVAGIKQEPGYNYQLGGVLILDGPKTLAAETVITITCIATALTFGTPPLTLSLVVYYLNP